jgi:replicative DNA helicase
MSQFRLSDEHADPEAERRLLGAIASDPKRYWKLSPHLQIFSSYEQAAEDLFGAIQAEEEPPDIPEDWEAAADDPEATLRRLRDLWRRRRIAALQEDLGSLMQNGDRSATEILQYLEEHAAKVRAELRESTAGTLRLNEEVTSDVLEEAREARDEYQSTGDPIRGMRTGIGRLDEIIGGLQPGLTIISGGPGIGKTTFALQIGADAASGGVPTLYVTFENSPRQLVLKGIGRVGDVNPREIRRGTVPIKQTRRAAKRWKEKARRLGFIEGRSDLNPGQIRGKARRLLARFSAEECLIVVDYLQLYAKAASFLSGSDSLRERVEQMGQRLRELSMRLRSPVLAISSQSRAAGYSSGGSADLDTLKESGDLEYGSDVVAILTKRDAQNGQEAFDAVTPLELTVAKNRNGETGRMKLNFIPKRGEMRPPERQRQPR